MDGIGEGQDAWRADSSELIADLLSSESFAAARRLVFERFDIVDESFYARLAELQPVYRDPFYEALLRAIGLIEDPEIVGVREQRIIEVICAQFLEPVSAGDAGGPGEDVRRWLELATSAEFLQPPSTAIRLAIVHHALRFATETGGALTGRPAFLNALGDLARARILHNVHNWTDDRTWDAGQFLLRGIDALETLWDEGVDDEEASVLEPVLMSASIELIEMNEQAERAAVHTKVPAKAGQAGGEES
jgi:hypothetical protein